MKKIAYQPGDGNFTGKAKHKAIEDIYFYLEYKLQQEQKRTALMQQTNK